ncbi:restriction endonuclease subunit S [Treponema sp. OMZ 840]|uniref:restriction endonuclease subunit S n=1 Tax=Treponema sp. OMZ 840 TaxID=244313 RepID=UPI003D91CE4E
MYEELGLFDELKPVNYTVKNLSESFGKTGRLDSEYYDKKYDSLFKEIGKSTFESLAQLAVIEKSVEPGSDNYEESGIPFVRVQDFTKFGIISPKIYLSSTLFKNTIKPKKDTVLLSKDGTVGIAYKTDKDEDCITSSAILHLTTKSKKIIPEYLTLVLNSFIVKMQAERDAGGSIINHWKKSEIEQVKIPILDMDKQQQISELVEESKRLREKSKELLDRAVKSVELAIEEGEEKALEFLCKTQIYKER